MKTKRLLILCTALIMLLSVSALAVQDAYPVTVSNYNQEVTLEKEPERVVILTINSAEILAALGKTDNIIGIAKGHNDVQDILPEYQDALKDLPYPKSLNDGIPTLENMLDIKPDMIVMNAYYFNAVKIFGTLEDYTNNGINIYANEGSYVPNCTIENTYNDVRNLGALFNAKERAEEIVAEMQNTVKDVQEKVEGKEKKKVMLFDSTREDMFITAGGIGLVNNMIELAGGENIFKDVEKQFGGVNIEEIIARNPDIIVISEYFTETNDDVKNKIDYLNSTEELSEVTAVKEGNYVIVPVIATFPGLQNINYITKLAKAIAPESF